MDFGLSAEQRLLEQSLAGFLDQKAPSSRARALAAADDAFDRELWHSFAGLGATGILIAPEHGGSGLGLLDAAVVGWTLGARATPLPFLGTAVMAPVALREAGTADQQARLLPRIAAGDLRVGIAATEAVSRRDGAGVRREGTSLHGSSLFVIDAESADVFLIAADDGSLALVPRDAGGLEVRRLTTVDRTRRFGELGLTGVEPAEWLGATPAAAQKATQRMIDAGRLLLAADALGAADRALALAVEWAGSRRQFGRTIGSFQAVKHMCAEMAAAIEPARSLLWWAAHAFDAMPEDAPLAAVQAKAHVCEMASQVVRTATEVHGGTGFTAECDVQLFFKRAALDRHLLGSPGLLRERAAALQGL